MRTHAKHTAKTIIHRDMHDWFAILDRLLNQSIRRSRRFSIRRPPEATSVDPDHDWQLLGQAMHLRPRNVEVQAVLGDVSDVAKPQRRIEHTQWLWTSSTGLGRIDDGTWRRHMRKRRLEAILAARVLGVGNPEEDLNPVALDALVLDAAWCGGFRRTSSNNECTGQQSKEWKLHGWLCCSNRHSLPSWVEQRGEV